MRRRCIKSGEAQGEAIVE